MTSWKDKFAFSPEYTEATFCGRPRKFRPLSPVSLFKLAQLSEPLSKGIALLVTNSGQDQEVCEKTFPVQDGGIAYESIKRSIDPNLAAVRARQTQEAIALMLSVLADPKNQRILGELLIESLQDELGGEKVDPIEFFARLDLPEMGKALEAMYAANKGFLGPFQGRVAGWFRQRVGEEAARAGTRTDEASDPGAADTTKEATGDLSKTRSSGQQVE